MREDHYARRSARVVLVDPLQRVLLLECAWDRLRPELGTAWWTPGGGVEDGETLPEAAARELREETGVVTRPDGLGEVVAFTTGYADLGFAKGRFRDDFFFLNAASDEISTQGLEEIERAHVRGHRWWTLAEVWSAEDTVIPHGLAPLLARLLHGDRSGTPVELPWHHEAR